ncbi:hypothetical protein [Catenuloplanes japonicus]|uniref:hypothetical protein n=1 Tax=Catenuloplanes japonicus TaxID=33876 RepID=UPI000526ED6A|nr:hypothetical protein [Catenuloplanes japonicus]
MSNLDNPAVERSGDGYKVGDLRVLPNPVLGWGIYTGPDLSIADGGAAIGWASEDDAVGVALNMVAA